MIWAGARMPAPGWVWVVGAVVASVLLFWAQAGAQELNGLLTSSYSAARSRTSEETRADFDNVRETLDVNWNRFISPVLGYRLSLRAERLDGSSLVTGGGTQTSTETSSLLLQPGLDLTLATPGLSINGGYRLRESFRDETSQSTLRLSERNAFLRLFYNPEQLPSVSLQLERSTSVDNRHPVARDEADTRFQAGSQWTLRDLSLGYTFGRLVHEDHQQERTETQDSHVGTAGYAGRFFDDRLTVQTDLSMNYSRTVDEFFSPGTAQFDRALQAALQAGPNLNPLLGPMVSFAPPFPLTPFSAVGFRLPASEAVTDIVIGLAVSPACDLPGCDLRTFLAFRVFFTDDDPTSILAAWTEVASVSPAWDSVQSRFTLTIPATAARSFKAWVSANSYPGPITATAISAPTTVGVTAGSERSRSSRSGTLSTGLSYTPIKAVTVSYNMNVNVSRQDPEAIDTTSGSQTLSLTVRPHPLVTTTAIAQYSFNDSNQAGAVDTSLTSYALTAGWTPLTTLSTTLGVGRTESRTAGQVDNRNDTASLSAAAKVFPTLTLDSAYALSKGENFVSQQETIGQDLTFRVAAQMAPWISMVGNYGVQVRDTTPPPAGTNALSITHTVGGGTVYSVSRLVNFTTRFDYVSSSDGSSLASTYKVDWVPTSKMSFFVSYSTTQSQFGDAKSSTDAVTANGRWQLNRALDISANYSFSHSSTQSTLQDVQLFNVTASARF